MEAKPGMQEAKEDAQKVTPKHKLPASHAGKSRLVEILTVYHFLFIVSVLANLAALIALLLLRSSASRSQLLQDLATGAATNILVAILIRQDYVVNILFFSCLLVPLKAPVNLRHRLTLIYENGGIHSGCATSSLVWFIAFTVFLTIDQVKGDLGSVAVLVLDYCLVAFLAGIVITALPRLRAAYHNIFENMHRWAGWGSLGLFWVELVLFVRLDALDRQVPLGLTLAKTPAFWLLLIASCHSVYPWLFLRKVPFTAEKLSDHAILLHHKLNLPKFRGLAISASPLREWHPFASFPNRRDGGGTLIVSNAGDWTRHTIDNPRPYYYVKGFPKTGVLTMATIYRRVVVVTTGSGIGPCLGVLADMPAGSCRILWSTPSPEATFGSRIVATVKEIDEEAIIHDTRVLGRPDLLSMVENLFHSSGAEAVFCISNKHLTGKIVYGMRERGIPAFGPVWDS